MFPVLARCDCETLLYQPLFYSSRKFTIFIRQQIHQFSYSTKITTTMSFIVIACLIVPYTFVMYVFYRRMEPITTIFVPSIDETELRGVVILNIAILNRENVVSQQNDRFIDNSIILNSQKRPKVVYSSSKLISSDFNIVDRSKHSIRTSANPLGLTK